MIAFHSLADLLAGDESRTLLSACQGQRCHLVGGSLRATLLGLPFEDLDAVVDHHGPKIAARLAAALPGRLVDLGGQRFSAWRIVGQRYSVDLWDRSGGSVEADLARRDFTVNSFALDLESGHLLDPHGGLSDLEKRLLRPTSSTTFESDPVRILRLARLSAEPGGLAPVAGVEEMASRHLSGLIQIAIDRVRNEFRRTLAAPHAERGLAILAAVGFPALRWPRVGTDLTVELPRLSLAAERRLQRLKFHPAGLEGLLPAPAEEAWLAVRLALLFSESELQRLNDVGIATRKDVRAALCFHQSPPVENCDLALRRFLLQAGETWPLAVAYQCAREDGLSDSTVAAIQRLVEMQEAKEQGALSLEPLVNGHQLQQELDLGPGPVVGRLIREIGEAHLRGAIRTPREALDLARTLLMGD